jgi:hypothetical protein
MQQPTTTTNNNKKAQLKQTNKLLIAVTVIVRTGCLFSLIYFTAEIIEHSTLQQQQTKNKTDSCKISIRRIQT